MPTVTAIRKVETRPLWSGIVASPDRSEPSGVSVALSSHGVMTSNGPRDRLAMLVPSPLPAPILGPSSGVSVEDTVIDRVHLFDPRSTRETPHTVLPRGMHPAGYLHTSPRRSTLTRSRSGVSVVSRIDPRSTLDARRSTLDAGPLPYPDDSRGRCYCQRCDNLRLIDESLRYHNISSTPTNTRKAIPT